MAVWIILTHLAALIFASMIPKTALHHSTLTPRARKSMSLNAQESVNALGECKTPSVKIFSEFNHTLGIGG